MRENLALTQNTSAIQKRKNEQKIAIFEKKQATASARKTFAIMSGLDDTSVHLHK